MWMRDGPCTSRLSNRTGRFPASGSRTRLHALAFATVATTVAGDEETETFTIGLARPFPSPRFTARVVRVEPDAPECLPAAMRTAFHVAPILVLLAESGITVGSGLVNHRAPLASPS